MKHLPELLCPAGSPDALDAAIEGGADAVYLGGASFNARMNAKNFGGDALRSAVLRAHAYGVKVYLTLNTLITDRELPAYLDSAREALHAGVDALIVADLGGISALRQAFPGVELHASTQMSAHHSYMGHELQRLGFTRMVIARETSAENIKAIVQKSPIEVEIFIHGALCVSHSGQCLFSSMVGGRSGNRGECAQPCRLPYSCDGCAKNSKNAYPLSLKDLSLAAHVPELIEAGVASLKIEGRMKSPEYVRDTARIWRRLLDENRGATPAETQALASAFSRGGFTDGYYTDTIDRRMLGVRSEADKSDSRSLTPFTGITRRLPLSLQVTLQRNRPATLSLSDGTHTVTAVGDVPMEAINAPLSRETVERNLSKFGGTPYTAASVSLVLDEGLMLPISRLNDLRRRALMALEDAKATAVLAEEHPHQPQEPSGKRVSLRSARFYAPAQITPRAKAFFDRIYLPVHKYTSDANGVILPPVVFDRDDGRVLQMLKQAAEMGARFALVGNIGHLSLVRRAGLVPIGDFRLNVTNTQTVAALERMGVSSVILSPELSLPRLRDIRGNTEAIVYGRLPLMTLEKCLIRDLTDCNVCETNGFELRDRRGFVFPVLREWEHRNLICNSLPTNMSDREDALVQARITARHFLFTTESADDVDAVISAFTDHAPLPFPVRRIGAPSKQ